MCKPVFPPTISEESMPSEEANLETDEEMEPETDAEDDAPIIDFDYDDPEFLRDVSPQPSLATRVSSMFTHLLQIIMGLDAHAGFSGCNIRISNSLSPIDEYISFYEMDFDNIQWQKIPRDPRFDHNVLLRRTSLRAREWAIESSIFRARLWNEETPNISVSTINSSDIADADLGITDHSAYEYMYSGYVVWLPSYTLLPSVTEIRESAVLYEQPDPDKIVYFIKHLFQYDDEYYIQLFTRVAVMK